MMAKITLSLPDDLKEQMDTVSDDVNWSATAADAFTRKLGEIAQAKDVKDLSDVAARFKAEDLEDEQEDFQRGHEAGYEWAKNFARPKGLRAIRKELDCVTRDTEWSAKLLATWAADPDLDYLFEDKEQDEVDDFYRGFAYGAIALYDEVAKFRRS